MGNFVNIDNLWGGDMSHLHIQEKLNYPSVVTSERPLALPLAQTAIFKEYMLLSNKESVFSDLLHMDKAKTRLVNDTHKLNVLNLLANFYRIAAEALEQFYAERMVHLFDPHVGEASCQIRAIKITLMMRSLNLKLCTQKIEQAQYYKSCFVKLNKLHQLYTETSHRIEGAITIDDFLTKYCLDGFITKDDLFIITSYFLTKYKVIIDLEKDIIDYQAIQDIWHLTRNASKKIVQHMQCMNSFYSIDFIFTHIRKNNHNYRLLSYLLQKDESARWILPSIENSKFLFSMIEKHNIPLYLRIYDTHQCEQNKEKYTLLYSHKRYHIVSTVHPQLKCYLPGACGIAFQCYMHNPIFQGSLDALLIRLQQFDFPYLALASLSSHAQYPSGQLQDYMQDPYRVAGPSIYTQYLKQKTQELRNYQASALTHGFCNMNPKTLVICHIQPRQSSKISV